MKTSVEWLKEYSDIDVSAKELGDILTMTGSKVETIESRGNDIKNVVVGKILAIKKEDFTLLKNHNYLEFLEME